MVCLLRMVSSFRCTNRVRSSRYLCTVAQWNNRAAPAVPRSDGIIPHSVTRRERPSNGNISHSSPDFQVTSESNPPTSKSMNSHNSQDLQPKHNTRSAPANNCLAAVEKKPKSANYVKYKMKDWPKLTDGYAEEFRAVMRSREYDTAMALYERMRESGNTPRQIVLTGLLTICQKKSHLNCALELFNDFSMIGITPNESAYMSLIRCHSDNGQIAIALKLIDEMKLLSLELKLRTYHPILEAACKVVDFNSSLMILNQMLDDDVIPRSEQFSMFLEAAALSGALKKKENRDKIEKLLSSDRMDLLDMDLAGLERILTVFRGTSLEEIQTGVSLERIQREGVLRVESIALNRQTLSDALDIIEAQEARKILKNKKKELKDNSSDELHDTRSMKEYNKRLSLRKPSRMVNILKGTCCCPNCGGDLNPLFLDAKGRERVRQGLISIASSTSPFQAASIQVGFSRFCDLFGCI